MLDPITRFRKRHPAPYRTNSLSPALDSWHGTLRNISAARDIVVVTADLLQAGVFDSSCAGNSPQAVLDRVAAFDVCEVQHGWCA